MDAYLNKETEYGWLWKMYMSVLAGPGGQRDVKKTDVLAKAYEMGKAIQ